MQFKEIFTVLRKYLSDGYDVPSFFREFIQMITDVPESEWDTPKDPSGRCKDNTLKSYVSRGISKKFARSIVYRLDTFNLEDRLEHLPIQAATALVDDFQKYNQSIDINNYPEKIAEHVCENIQSFAGLIAQDTVDENITMQQSVKLKREYGESLLREARNYCTFPGCAKPLYKESGGRTQWVYEIVLIDKNDGDQPANLMAACPDCHATYLLDNDKTLMKRLRINKSVLSKAIMSDLTISDIKIEQGLIKVLEKIKKLNVKELAESSLDPLRIEEKINAEKEPGLYITVRGQITSYYLSAKRILISLDKKGVLDYEELQEQMKGQYRKLKKKGNSQMEIFDLITKKIQIATRQEGVYCQIIAAYFVQNCEVFDAISQ